MPIIECSQCCIPFQKRTGEINRALSKGYNLYCGDTCHGLGISKRQKKNYVLSYRNRRNEKLANRPAPNQCDVCGASESVNKNGKSRMHFDHCHETGRFRGWICGPCNRILGLAKDRPERLIALAKYLEKHHAN